MAESKVKKEPLFLYQIHIILHKYLPIIILLLSIILLHKFSIVDLRIEYTYISFLELFIILYFVSEILVDFILYENKRVFLKDYWINILLVIPVLSVFRLSGSLLQLTRIGSIAPVVGEISAVHRYSRFIPNLQKILHVIVDGKKVALKSTYTKKIIIVLKTIIISKFSYLKLNDNKEKSEK